MATDYINHALQRSPSTEVWEQVVYVATSMSYSGHLSPSSHHCLFMRALSRHALSTPLTPFCRALCTMLSGH